MSPTWLVCKALGRSAILVRECDTRDEAEAEARALARRYPGTSYHVYRHALECRVLYPGEAGERVS